MTGRVVVLRALGLGDLLTAVPALRALRRAHPAAHIALAGPSALAALLPRGLVDDVRDVSFVRGIGPGDGLDADLAGAELAVNLHGRGPQSTALLAGLRPDRLVAYGLTSSWRDGEHEVHRWCRLMTEAGMPADPGELALDPPPAVAAVTGAVVVHPGAAQPSRRWPTPRWAEVARGLTGLGERVVVTGGPDERHLALEVAARAGLDAGDVLAERTSPTGLAALVGAARLLVCADTGVAHLATGLGTPSVVLFGPTPPTLWGPPPARAQHRALWSGRTGDNLAARPDAGLLELTPADVLAAATDLLSTARQEVLPGRTVVG